MCTDILVCHGDGIKLPSLKNKYTKGQKEIKQKITKMNNDDCRPATFYITSDGKYAVDADFVSLADMNNPEFDISSVPKIKLGGG